MTGEDGAPLRWRGRRMGLALLGLPASNHCQALAEIGTRPRDGVHARSTAATLGDIGRDNLACGGATAAATCPLRCCGTLG
jgi:hypothetical protein